VLTNNINLVSGSGVLASTPVVTATPSREIECLTTARSTARAWESVTREQVIRSLATSSVVIQTRYPAPLAVEMSRCHAHGRHRPLSALGALESRYSLAPCMAVPVNSTTPTGPPSVLPVGMPVPQRSGMPSVALPLPHIISGRQMSSTTSAAVRTAAQSAPLCSRIPAQPRCLYAQAAPTPKATPATFTIAAWIPRPTNILADAQTRETRQVHFVAIRDGRRLRG